MCLGRARDDCHHSIDTQELFKDATCYVRKPVPRKRRERRRKKYKDGLRRPKI